MVAAATTAAAVAAATPAAEAAGAAPVAAVAAAPAAVAEGSYENGDGTSADTTDLKFKRAFGLAFLSAGILAIGYVVAKARNVKKEIDAQGDDRPEDGPPVV